MGPGSSREVESLHIFATHEKILTELRAVVGGNGDDSLGVRQTTSTKQRQKERWDVRVERHLILLL